MQGWIGAWGGAQSISGSMRVQPVQRALSCRVACGPGWVFAVAGLGRAMGGNERNCIGPPLFDEQGGRDRVGSTHEPSAGFLRTMSTTALEVFGRACLELNVVGRRCAGTCKRRRGRGRR
jgi:hypothetical protein